MTLLRPYAFAAALAAAVCAQDSRPQESPQRAEAVVAAALRDLAAADASRREAAVETLTQFAAAHRERIVEKLEHENADVRLAVVRVFRRTRTKEAAPAIRAVTVDRDPRVREEALLCLAVCAPDDGAQMAMSLLGSERETRVLRQCLAILGRAKDWNAVPRILLALERLDDPYLRDKAFSALRSITNRRADDDVVQWQAIWEERVKQETARPARPAPRPGR
jgi:HEAT repeat protein